MLGGSLNFKNNFQLWLFKYFQIKRTISFGFFGGKTIQNQTSHKNSPKPQKLGINSKPKKTNNLHERTDKDWQFFENHDYTPKPIFWKFWKPMSGYIHSGHNIWDHCSLQFIWGFWCLAFNKQHWTSQKLQLFMIFWKKIRWKMIS